MCYYSFFEGVKPLMKAWSNTNNTITEQQYAKINNARYMRYRKGQINCLIEEKQVNIKEHNNSTFFFYIYYKITKYINYLLT